MEKTILNTHAYIKNKIEQLNITSKIIILMQLAYSIYFICKFTFSIPFDKDYIKEILLLSTILFILIPVFSINFLTREKINKLRHFFNNIFFISWLLLLDLYIVKQCTINTFNFIYDLKMILSITLFGIFCNVILRLLEKSTKIIIKILFILIYLVFAFVFLIGSFVYSLDMDLEPIETDKIYRHKYMYDKISNSSYRTHYMNHFPKEIPEGISNYSFYIDQSFLGENIDYVRFKTNKEYIQKVIELNKKDICESFKPHNTDSRYTLIPYNEITNGEYGYKEQDNME